MGRVARRRVNRLRRVAIARGALRVAGGAEWAGDGRDGSDVCDPADWEAACARELAELDGDASASDSSWAGDDRSDASDGSVGAAWDRAVAEEMAAEFGPAFPDDDDDDDDDDAWAREWATTLNGPAAGANGADGGDSSGGDSSDGDSSDDSDGDGDGDDSSVDEVALAREAVGAARVVGAGKPPPPATKPPKRGLATDFTIVAPGEAKRRRTGGPPQPQRGSVVRARADSKEDLRRAHRAAKFAKEAAAPPPVPKKTMAHPGGKITSNKDEATAAFLARKAAMAEFEA